MTVKIDCESKNKYLEDFINLVKTKCRKIEIIKPTESKKCAKYKVDRKTGKIQCIPNENNNCFLTIIITNLTIGITNMYKRKQYCVCFSLYR